MRVALSHAPPNFLENVRTGRDGQLIAGELFRWKTLLCILSIPCEPIPTLFGISQPLQAELQQTRVTPAPRREVAGNE